MKTYTKQFLFKFAAEARKYPQADLDDLLSIFIESEDDKFTYMRVLDDVMERTKISHSELKSKRRYGRIPECKQITSRVLNEIGYSENRIAELLPELGGRITIHSQIAKSKDLEYSDKNYAMILNQLLQKYGKAE